MADTPLSTLKRSVASPVAGSPVKEPWRLRSPKTKSLLEVRISGPTPSVTVAPPARRPLKLSVTASPPEAVETISLAPPRARSAAAESLARLSM